MRKLPMIFGLFVAPCVGCDPSVPPTAPRSDSDLPAGERMTRCFALIFLFATACAGSDSAQKATGGIHAELAWSQARGLRVVEVPVGGAAHVAGLQPEDRILAIDGARLAQLTQAQVVELLRGPVGSLTSIEILRRRKHLTLTVERKPYRPSSPK